MTRLRLLVVEDEAMNRALLRAVLARAADPPLGGSELLESDSLAAARAVLGSQRVDVVLLDVRLPDGSGLDLALELARRPPAERPRIVILSASVLPMEREAAMEAGCDAFLAKPYRPAQLVELLTDLVSSADPTPASVKGRRSPRA